MIISQLELGPPVEDSTIERSPVICSEHQDQLEVHSRESPTVGWFLGMADPSDKQCLKKTIRRTTLNYDELATLLNKVESVVSSRPLTYMEDDQNRVSYTLSPSHLTNGQRIIDSPNEIISTNSALTKQAKHH